MHQSKEKKESHTAHHSKYSHSHEASDHPVIQPAQSYSSGIAQIIQSAGGLLSSVSRDTLVIVMLFISLFGGGYILIRQAEVIERNTTVMQEMKAIMQNIADYEKKNDLVHP
jgi:hypothetical protein